VITQSNFPQNWKLSKAFAKENCVRFLNLKTAHQRFLQSEMFFGEMCCYIHCS